MHTDNIVCVRLYTTASVNAALQICRLFSQGARKVKLCRYFTVDGNFGMEEIDSCYFVFEFDF